MRASRFAALTTYPWAHQIAALAAILVFVSSVHSNPIIQIGGADSIGTRSLNARQRNPVFGVPGEDAAGLNQEWYTLDHPGDITALKAAFATNDRLIPPFKAAHGSSWWTGNHDPLFGTAEYPNQVIRYLDVSDTNQYAARLTGQILIPESGQYRFADASGDFAYLAVDLDRSGASGDSSKEILINDNLGTNLQREANNGGGQIGLASIDVVDGGEWLSIEFIVAEAQGNDAGILYWDYDPSAPEGHRLGGGFGFPTVATDAISRTQAASLYIPDTHLRAIGLPPLLSADLVAVLDPLAVYQLDVDGRLGISDKLVVENFDSSVLTSVVDLNGARINVLADPLTLRPGDTFDVIDADRIAGTARFESSANVVWDTNQLSSTGEITVVAIPEPSSAFLTGIGLLVLACNGLSRRRRSTW